jgi:hypothetical protein
MTEIPAWYINLSMICFVVMACFCAGMLAVSLLILGRLRSKILEMRVEHLETVEQIVHHLDSLSASTASLLARLQLRMQRRRVPLEHTLAHTRRALQTLNGTRQRLAGWLHR